MNYPSEFIKKRSFEVVWAVFRVAQVVPHVGLKQLLEDRALQYFSHKNSETLDALEEVVQLGSKLGDITAINSAVLLREIGALQVLLIEAKQTLEENSGILEQESIEHMFSEPPVLFSDFAQMIHSDANTSEIYPHGESSHIDVNPANDISESGKVLSGKATQNGSFTDSYNALSFSGKSPANDITESGNVFSGNKSEKNRGSISGNTGNEISRETAQNDRVVLSSAERKERIVSILKSKNFCNINDILERLPKVSDRTVRYDIKTLVDSKIVERVGNGGPNSFLRLRKKEQ
ncbi:MAG: DeoR family transcriptional regulator [Candidatus Paceibacterota bacterium]